MGMRNDSQNPCLDRYLRGMEQRERNRKRRRNARLKKLLKEAAICIGAAVLTAGGLPSKEPTGMDSSITRRNTTR